MDFNNIESREYVDKIKKERGDFTGTIDICEISSFS